MEKNKIILGLALSGVAYFLLRHTREGFKALNSIVPKVSNCAVVQTGGSGYEWYVNHIYCGSDIPVTKPDPIDPIVVGGGEFTPYPTPCKNDDVDVSTRGGSVCVPKEKFSEKKFFVLLGDYQASYYTGTPPQESTITFKQGRVIEGYLKTYWSAPADVLEQITVVATNFNGKGAIVTNGAIGGGTPYLEIPMEMVKESVTECFDNFVQIGEVPSSTPTPIPTDLTTCINSGGTWVNDSICQYPIVSTEKYKSEKTNKIYFKKIINNSVIEWYDEQMNLIDSNTLDAWESEQNCGVSEPVQNFSGFCGSSKYFL